MARLDRNPIKRLLLEREWRLLAQSEAQICRQFDRVIAVTEEDRTALERLTKGTPSPITVIPICVDVAGTRRLDCDPGSRRALHLGTMYWPPNVEGVLWFARDVLPLVRERVPGARLDIVGKRPPKSVARLHGRLGVEVVGYVADPHPSVQRSRVLIVPLRAGGGMRVKILDAWMWGIPTVSTPIGAEGIDIRAGENILIAESPGKFAAAVVRLMSDGMLWERIAAAGRAWVEEHYDWRTTYRALDELYAEL
jgi:glycosyltransferase involved in cell wall biosynthesis